ncbi:hypothetical protein FKM82_020609 [Ascaphus truei]
MSLSLEPVVLGLALICVPTTTARPKSLPAARVRPGLSFSVIALSRLMDFTHPAWDQ